MDKCREAFEKWFKTTESYDFLKQMNYFNIDLFTFNKDRNQYQHSAVQIAYMTWQEQQKRIDELNQQNEKCRLDHAAYKKGVKNIIHEKLKQIEGRDFTIAAMERSLLLANAKVDELQSQVDAASKETQHALRYVEEDMRGNHEFLKMAMIRTFKSLAQALAGEKHE